MTDVGTWPDGAPIPSGLGRSLDVEDGSQAVVFSRHKLQLALDHSLALRDWFRAVRPEGYLIVIVPRAIAPQGRAGSAARPYSITVLLADIEESLPRRSYKLRLACDLAAVDEAPPPGSRSHATAEDVVAVVQRLRDPTLQ